MLSDTERSFESILDTASEGSATLSVTKREPVKALTMKSIASMMLSEIDLEVVV